MRNIVAKLVIGVAITTIGMYGADNSIGTWKRNVAKSKSTPPATNPITSLTIVYEAVDGGVKTTVTGQRKDGTAINSTSTVKYDGKEYPVTGAPWDTISVKQIDANTFTSEVKKTGGKYHSKGRMVISKDGKTMTLTTKGTNEEGKPSSGKFIYEKQ
jgi:ABC-type xylose transport system substrate-binding protein